MTVVFKRSQLSYEHQTSPISFGISPFRLLRSDLKLVASLLGYVILTVLPFRSNNPRSELNLRYFGNVVSIVLQILLVIGTLVGLIGFILFVFLPIPGVTLLLYAGIYAAVCGPIMMYLNFGPGIVVSNPDLLSEPQRSSFKDEKWFFINGIIVGDYWLQSALDELSILVKRDIYGIRNRTAGFILDLIECLIQRDFGYRTRDIRDAYRNIKEALLTKDIKKVVVVAHSQGGIILSMALDSLLADLPRENFRKLEIYTFACAANHFNNPKLSMSAESKAAIPYIEHYTNARDFVALFGVLHFTHRLTKYPNNRYAGRVFNRPNHGGHMFVQHYLIKMFGTNSTFLDQPMTGEDPHKIGKTVREVSRFVSYLRGRSPDLPQE